jgi:hypothetical protein
VEKISLAVNNYFSSLEGGEVVAPALDEVAAATATSEETAEVAEEVAEEKPVDEPGNPDAVSEADSAEAITAEVPALEESPEEKDSSDEKHGAEK